MFDAKFGEKKLTCIRYRIRFSENKLVLFYNCCTISNIKCSTVYFIWCGKCVDAAEVHTKLFTNCECDRNNECVKSQKQLMGNRVQPLCSVNEQSEKVVCATRVWGRDGCACTTFYQRVCYRVSRGRRLRVFPVARDRRAARAAPETGRRQNRICPPNTAEPSSQWVRPTSANRNARNWRQCYY